jgi:hypothetical protein
MRRGFQFFLSLLLLQASVGCATYSDRIDSAKARTARGDYHGAIDNLNDILGVGSTDELPDRWGSEKPLAILERGSLLQALEDFGASSRDLSAGETELELLDFKHDTAGQIGKYVYSDSSQDYETPPTERLALNAVNMLNFLALGNWSAASVEARRFTTMREYLESVDLNGHGAFGAYLSGLTFERLGQGDRALRYYEEAMARGTLPTLHEPVARLASSNPYRGPHIKELLGDGPGKRIGETPTEIITVVSLGRVPHKIPERIPIGAAVGLAGTFITGNPDILARSIFKVVVYPELTASGSRARNASVEIDGRRTTIDRVSSMGADITAEYERVKPRIIAAALTRMIARALAAEGARVAGRQAGGAGAVVGLLAALGTEAALVGLDKPDTRSWTMLADHVLISRATVEPGEHIVKVNISGGGLKQTREFPVTVEKGNAVVVVVTEPR